MFEYIHSKKRVKKIYRLIDKEYKKEKQIIPLFWTEHCIECAAPLCYTTCPRYKQREDGECIRIVNGITPIDHHSQLGALLEFRTWGKIESQLKIRPLSGKTYATVYSVITRLGYLVKLFNSIIPIRSICRFINLGWFSYRQKYINYKIRKRQSITHLELQVDLKNNDKPTKLLIDIKTVDKLLFRESISVPLDSSHFEIAIPPYEDSKEQYFINIHPANAEEHITINFQRLELLPRTITIGKKIKCVIWDLDNTLWDGVLIEDENVKDRYHFIELIKKLDRCGIVNSIASKNDYDKVIGKLRELGIEEYFVFVKINWNPKSINVSKIIKEMNINANTIVFVDDNPFERLEVIQQHPNITCIDPSELIEFSRSERFRMTVTEDSKKRRDTYKMLEALKNEEEEWKGNIDDFLINCHIEVEIIPPTKNMIPRCFELLQRTNQLNSSGRRLTMEQVVEIVNSSNYDSYALRSSDKFGDYGIIGFLIVDRKESMPTITDFVISCRVANKKIEPTIINRLAEKYGNQILFNYKKTSRNGPMFNVIEELGMKKEKETKELDQYMCMFNAKYPKIVSLKETL